MTSVILHSPPTSISECVLSFLELGFLTTPEIPQILIRQIVPHVRIAPTSIHHPHQNSPHSPPHSPPHPPHPIQPNHPTIPPHQSTPLPLLPS